MTARERQFFYAVAAGDLTATRAAIADGVDVNCIDFSGETDWAGYDAVDIATRLGRADIVQELVAGGAVNRIFVEAAIAAQRPDVVRVWLKAIEHERPRHLDSRGEDDQTLLMLAASIGSPAIVELLLGAGADPTLENEEGRTALAVAEQRQLDALWQSEAQVERFRRVADLLRAAMGPA